MAAFQKVYEEYARKVYKFLLSLTGSEDFAEELLQEAFYQALQHIDRFEGRCSLYTWLCQIGKNAWIKECRRRSRYADSPLEDLTIPAVNTSPEALFLEKEAYILARKALLTLEEPYRDVFILHALSGVKLKEIAAIYEKSESWARVTYFRARTKLAQEVLK